MKIHLIAIFIMIYYELPAPPHGIQTVITNKHTKQTIAYCHQKNMAQTNKRLAYHNNIIIIKVKS